MGITMNEISEAELSVVTDGCLAWLNIQASSKRLRAYWKSVGDALVIGKRLCGTNTQKFGQWCSEFGFGDIDRRRRCDAIWLSENWSAVVEFVKTSGRDINNPSEIRAAFQSSTPTTHFVYKMYDDAGCLLYVGVSAKPSDRWERHKDKPWFKAVSNIQTVRTESEQESRQMEGFIIRQEHPKFNVAGQPSYIQFISAVKMGVENVILELQRGFRLSEDDIIVMIDEVVKAVTNSQTPDTQEYFDILWYSFFGRISEKEYLKYGITVQRYVMVEGEYTDSFHQGFRATDFDDVASSIADDHEQVILHKFLRERGELEFTA